MTTRVDELMKVREANIAVECRGTFDCLAPKVEAKPDRTLEKALKAELTIPEEMEFTRRCRAKARACWEAGDNHAKYLWGGW
jgi:hypothetical protein